MLEEGISFSKNLLGNDKESRNLTSTGVLKYIKDSITYTPSGEMMLMLLQIDELDKMAAKYGKKPLMTRSGLCLICAGIRYGAEVLPVQMIII